MGGSAKVSFKKKFEKKFRNIMWTLFFAAGVIYTLQNIQENTERYLAMKTRSEDRLSKFFIVKVWSILRSIFDHFLKAFIAFC